MAQFTKDFKCISGAMADRELIDRGGKINLPDASLAELARMQITYPMMFKVSNPVTGMYSHCGVLEFTAPASTAVAPYWLMEHLGVAQGGTLRVENASLPRGSFIKIQPQQRAFIDLSNPKAVLESRMNGYSCLTKGDTISIHYNNRSYPINILQCKVGDRDVDAISIVEANVNVDFARPADLPPSPIHKPAPAPPAAGAGGYSSGPATASAPSAGGVSFGNRLLDEDSAKAPGAPAAAAAAAGGANGTSKPDAAAVASPVQASGYQAFGGAGRTLSGSAPAAAKPGASAMTARELRTDSYGRALKHQGGEEEKKEFKAFAGSGRSLK